ncbi:MAG: Crp/Fnr family transcriptional regulator [Bacteroidota bacterium]
MKEQLAYFIKANISNPIEEEIEAILEIFHLRQYKKGEIFKEQNKMCKEVGFIVSGSVRHFAIKHNGNEVTGRIAQKNNFVTDLISLRTKGATPIAIMTMEPTTLLVASVEDAEKLLEVNLTFNRLIREHMADSVVEFGKLFFIFLTGTAKERYRFILEHNPNLVKNVPLRFIASMIGITPTQLSRIRNNKED